MGVNSDPFHVSVIAASLRGFLNTCGRAIAADWFVPASVGNTQVEFKKFLANTLPNCGAPLHPCH